MAHPLDIFPAPQRLQNMPLIAYGGARAGTCLFLSVQLDGYWFSDVTALRQLASLWYLQTICYTARTLLGVPAEPLEWPHCFWYPKLTQWVLVKIQGAGNQAATQMKKWWMFEHFLSSRNNWKVTLKILNACFRYKMIADLRENAPVYSLLH